MKRISLFCVVLLTSVGCQNHPESQDKDSSSNYINRLSNDAYLKSTEHVVSLLKDNQLDKLCDMTDMDCYPKEMWPGVRDDVKKRFKNAHDLINAFGIVPKNQWKVASARIQVNPFSEDDTSTLLYEKILVPLDRSGLSDSSILYLGIEFNCSKSASRFISFDILKKKFLFGDFDFDHPGVTDYLPASNVRIARNFVRYLTANDEEGAFSLINELDKNEHTNTDVQKSYHSDYMETYNYVHNRKLRPTGVWKTFKVQVSSPDHSYSLFFDEVVIPFETESPNAADPVYLYVGFEKIFGRHIHEFGIITRNICGVDGDRLVFEHRLTARQSKMIHPDH